MPIKYKVIVINILHFTLIFILSHPLSVMYSLFGRYVSFFSLMPITFKLYTHVSTCSADAYEVLSVSQIFYIWQPFLFFHIYIHILQINV